MGRKVAEHPAAAMEEHENGEAGRCPGGLYNVELQVLSVEIDSSFRLVDPGQIDRRAVLGIDQNLTRVPWGKPFDRRSAARIQRVQKLLHAADDIIVDGLRGHFDDPPACRLSAREYARRPERDRARQSRRESDHIGAFECPGIHGRDLYCAYT